MKTHWKNVDLIAKTFKDLLPQLDQGLKELQDAKRGALMEKEKDKTRSAVEQIHPILRSSQSPGAGRIEAEENLKSIHSPRPGIIKQLPHIDYILSYLKGGCHWTAQHSSPYGMHPPSFLFPIFP